MMYPTESTEMIVDGTEHPMLFEFHSGRYGIENTRLRMDRMVFSVRLLTDGPLCFLKGALQTISSKEMFFQKSYHIRIKVLDIWLVT